MSVSKLDATITGSGSNYGTLTIEKEGIISKTYTAKLKSCADSDIVEALGTILSQHPMSVSKLDTTITGSESKPGCLTVDNGKAKLTTINEKTALILGKIVGSVPKILNKKVQCITFYISFKFSFLFSLRLSSHMYCCTIWTLWIASSQINSVCYTDFDESIICGFSRNCQSY